MEQKEILEKIEELFTNQKSSGFLTHLLHSYLPLNKAKTVIEKPEGKRPMTCAITGQKLISLTDVYKMKLDQIDDNENFIKSLMVTSDEEGNIVQKHPDADKFKEKLGNRILGYIGEETSTLLCEDAVKCLLIWTQNKMLKGDKKINWIVKKLNLNNNKPLKGNNKPKKQFNKVHKIINKPSKHTLGDLQSLQDLKKKLQAQEKK